MGLFSDCTLQRLGGCRAAAHIVTASLPRPAPCNRTSFVACKLRTVPPRRAPQSMYNGIASSARQHAAASKLILLWDVMDTLVADPFYTHLPAHLGMPLKDIIAVKHPTAWVEFERGEIDEDQLFAKFFKDSRPFDGAGMLRAMIGGYEWKEGMKALLQRLHSSGHVMFAMSNYPVWYRHIDAKLGLSNYLELRYMSCTGPMKGLRKPSPDCFAAVQADLHADPSNLLLIDDRRSNVEAAHTAGWQALLFTDHKLLQQQLVDLGITVASASDSEDARAISVGA